MGTAAKKLEDTFQLVGTVLENKYRIDHIVAEGGFGVVYQGLHLTLEKPVAVKVLKVDPEFTANQRKDFVHKFALEAKTIARLTHPNIVQAIDFGSSQLGDGEMSPWMVMEWLEGDTLGGHIAKRRPGTFTPQEVLELVKPVCEALAYAHVQGVAHRDIKPANIMLTHVSYGTVVKLMDFGIAKFMEDGEQSASGETRTRTKGAAFSPQYAAPEQISNTRTGPWTDVHALALIIVEMLIGRRAYDCTDMTALMGSVLASTRPTPGRFQCDVGAWEEVLNKGLAIRPNDRYADATEFLSALVKHQPAKVQNALQVPAADTGNNQTRATGLRPIQDLTEGTVMAPEGSVAASTPSGSTTMRSSVVTSPIPADRPAGPAPWKFAVGGVLATLLAVGAGVALKSKTDAPPAAAQAARAPAEPTPVQPPVAAPQTTPQAPPTTLETSPDAGAAPSASPGADAGTRRVTPRRHPTISEGNHQPAVHVN